jgi:hypothetical protein
LKGRADVVLRIEGEDKRYYARAIYDEPDKVREALMGYLSHFPQDAVVVEARPL